MSLLVFFRWPHVVTFSALPFILQVVCRAARIGTGYIVRGEGKDSGTRIAADTHTTVLFVKTKLDDASRACFADGPYLCRWYNDIPTAAVGCILSWNDRDVPSFPDDVSMLCALVGPQHTEICEVLRACSVALCGHCAGPAYKHQRRRLNDNRNECTKACQRLQHRRDVLHAVLVLKVF